MPPKKIIVKKSKKDETSTKPKEIPVKVDIEEDTEEEDIEDIEEELADVESEEEAEDEPLEEQQEDNNDLDLELEDQDDDDNIMRPEFMDMNELMEKIKHIDTKNYRSPAYITKYEITKIIGIRANQIAQGSPAFIDGIEQLTKVQRTPEMMATIELEQRNTPLIIKRKILDIEKGMTFEYWPIYALYSR